tara:strand:+ start:3395 stop:4054 length:660 start_codon:yes stop_codon:yes gene_type:complete
MGLFPVKIGEEVFKLAVADTDETRSKGLSGYKRIGKNKGMIFIFPSAVRMNMIMHDMEFDLDFIFLDKNWTIKHLGSLDKDSPDGIYPGEACHLVIEIPKGTIERLKLKVGESVAPEKDMTIQFAGVQKFREGGRFEMIGDIIYVVKEDDIAAEDGRLQILNEDGEVVANIDNGCRVFSREHTDELIKKFKSGDKLGLAESMLEMLKIQDNQEQEHVKR